MIGLALVCGSVAPKQVDQGQLAAVAALALVGSPVVGVEETDTLADASALVATDVVVGS
jgi:hypothetical protein